MVGMSGICYCLFRLQANRNSIWIKDETRDDASMIRNTEIIQHAPLTQPLAFNR